MRNQGLGSWIHRQRVKSRDRVAIIHGDRQITYDALAERIDRLSNALHERGVRKGDRVAYLGGNHIAFLETFFACGQLGAIIVPINTRSAPPEIEYVLDDSATEVLVFDTRMRDLARAGSWSSGVRHRLHIDGEAYEAVESYEDALQAGSPKTRDDLVTRADPAMILYTSGTTGRPKGAVLTHGNFTWNSMNVLVDYDLTSSSTTLLIAPMFHVASLGMGALPTLLKGGRLVLHNEFVPADVLSDIAHHQVTLLSGVPTTFQLLAEHPDWEAADLSSLQMISCGGSQLPRRVSDAYVNRGIAFSMNYGMTETSPGCTYTPSRYAGERGGASGLSHFFTDVRIMNDDGEFLPAGEVGEIVIEGPNVIPEYWRKPEATAESRRGEWFRSGDLGYLDEDGFLYVSGRAKDMIISGGENIYPAAIEQMLMEIADLDAVALIAKPDEKWGEVPLAVVVTKSGNDIDIDTLRTHLEGRCAKFKMPREVVRVDEMPRTASGKIKKPQLAQQVLG